MYARCLCVFIFLISIAGRDLILSDDRVYRTSKRHTPLEKLNRRTTDMHLLPIYRRTRQRTMERSREIESGNEWWRSW
ncbi:hypothetical protein V1264_005483 [Littorina saxatilis]|uniref:Secreted protein n=1 Tax=Littorina saxatilis TaxID=31220 RepID=A0AAN9AZL2_9CAEN